MIRCPFCDHDQAETREECEQCGAWIGRQEGRSGASEETGVGLDASIRDLLAQNRRIEAIQRIRRATGATLSEASVEADRITAQMSQPAASGLEPLLADLLRQGRKIEAIKLYRDQTGADLKTAKDHVEAVQRLRGIELNPEMDGSPVLLMVLLLLFMGGAMLLWTLLRGQ